MMKRLSLILFLSLNIFATNHYVTTTGAGTKDSSSWANAWSLSEFVSNVESDGDGNSYYFKSGTYTLIEDLDVGTNRNYINFIGVKSATTAEPPTVDDWAYGDDRPLFVCGSYKFRPSGDYPSFRLFANLIFTSSYTGHIAGKQRTFFFNVKMTQSSTDSSVSCAYISNGLILSCEFINSNGIGVALGSGGAIINSFIHDCNNGIKGANGGDIVANTIVSGCTTGYYSGDWWAPAFLNHVTFYDCTTAINLNVYLAHSLSNILIDNCSTGISSGSIGAPLKIIMNNVNFNSVSTKYDTSDVWDLNNSELDPQFKDADNQNFEPQNLNLIGEAFPNTFVGTNTTNKNVAGACQVVRKASSTARLY